MAPSSESGENNHSHDFENRRGQLGVDVNGRTGAYRANSEHTAAGHSECAVTRDGCVHWKD
jgi:hypothetical protein